jgi:hypothetical protein
MDLSVRRSHAGGTVEHYPNVSPHKVRRDSHTQASLPLSPLPRGVRQQAEQRAREGVGEDTLRRIQTNGGTTYQTGNQVTYAYDL